MNKPEPRFYSSLRRIRRLAITADLARHLCLWLMGALLGVWCHFIGDFVLRWRMATRYTVTACVIVGIIIGFSRIFLRRLFRRPSVRDIALQIEREHRWRGLLASGVEFVEEKQRSSGLAEQVFGQLDAREHELGTGLVHQWRDTLGPIALLVVFCGLTWGAVQVYPDTASAWWHRLGRTDAVYPASVSIVYTTPGHGKTLVDQPISLTAEADGDLPETATLEYVYREQVHRVPVLRSGTSYTCRLGPLVDSFTYQFLIADAETPSYRIEVIPHLELSDVAVTITPPSYTDLPQRVEDASHLEVLTGTNLHLSATANRPVIEVVQIMSSDIDDEKRVTIDLPQASANIKLEWVARQSGTWWVEAADEDGFRNTQPVRYTLRVLEDRLPRTWVELPGRHIQVTADAKVSLTCHAEDDFAVQQWQLDYRIRGDSRQPERSGSVGLPILGVPNKPSIRGWQLDLSVLKLAVGDTVRYWVTARDNREPELQTGQSQEYEIRILSRLEALAILAEQQAEARERLGEIADDQERLLGVTRTLLHE